MSESCTKSSLWGRFANSTRISKSIPCVALGEADGLEVGPPWQTDGVMLDGRFHQGGSTAVSVVSVVNIIRQSKPTSRFQLGFTGEKYIGLVAGNGLQEPGSETVGILLCPVSEFTVGLSHGGTLE